MRFPDNSTVDSWKGPVLETLQTIAAACEVRTSDIVSHIESQEGFPGWDNWGMITQRGQQYPKARRDMSFAASKLRNSGEVFSPVRGRFTMVAPPPPPAPAPEVVQSRLQLVTDGEAAAGADLVPQMATPVDGENHPILVEDEGLRAMVISQTRCFGLWAAKARTCKTCPLAGFCRDAGVADYANIGYSKDAEIEAAITAASAPTPVEAPVETPVEVAAEEGAKTSSENNDELEIAPFQLFCSSCRKEIAKGSEFRQMAGSGVFHPGCPTS